MSRIATAIMFGCAIVLASDATFARPRIRVSSPPSPPKVSTAQPAKPAMVRSSKTSTTQAQKPGKAEPRKPFAAAPRTGNSTFVHINARPFAAAPAAAPAHRAMQDTGEWLGAAPNDPSPRSAAADGNAAGKAHAKEPATGPVAANDAAAATAEPPKLLLVSTNIQLASPTAPAPGKPAVPAVVPVVCYVQSSGACVPF